jgi:hypothetical protein
VKSNNLKHYRPQCVCVHQVERAYHGARTCRVDNCSGSKFNAFPTICENTTLTCSGRQPSAVAFQARRKAYEIPNDQQLRMEGSCTSSRLTLAGGNTTAVAVNRPACNFNERMCMLMPAEATG